MQIKSIKNIFGVFYLDPQKVPSEVAKHPIIVLLIGSVLICVSVLLIAEGVRDITNFVSLIFGLIGIAYGVSGLRLYLSLRRMAADGRGSDI